MHRHTTPSARVGAPVLFVLALSAALAAPAAAQGPTPGGDRLACSGLFGPDTSHARIVQVFGKDAAVYRQVDGAEGEKVGATVLFPRVVTKRLELFWADDKKRRGLATVRLSRESTWVAPNGLKIGMPLAEVEQLNGKAFELSGFDWDYGGQVTDWKDGTLAGEAPGGCTVAIGFTVPQGAPAEPASKVSGDVIFPSDDENIRAVAPVIGSISFGYPLPDAQ